MVAAVVQEAMAAALWTDLKGWDVTFGPSKLGRDGWNPKPQDVSIGNA